jgi:undecaprenyl-diphosphatase
MTALDAAVMRRRRAIARVALGLGVLSAAVLVIDKTSDLLPGPEGLQPWITLPSRPDAVRVAIESIVWLARPRVAVATAVVVGLAALWRGGPRAAVLVVVVAVVGPLVSDLKDVGPDTSAPSGHAAFAASVYGAACWLALRERRIVPAAALAAPAVLMGPARVIEGAHWPADVATGTALGVAWLLAVLAAGAPWAFARSR